MLSSNDLVPHFSRARPLHPGRGGDLLTRAARRARILARVAGELAGAMALIALSAIAWPAMAVATPAGPVPLQVDGASLFNGRSPLPARMRGHGQDLPPSAARCSNCHQDKANTSPGRSSADAQRPVLAGSPARREAALREESGRFAPLLDRQRLLAEQPRRGGPASRFDALSFCRLLREGKDPALVMVDASMPRYQLSDAQCSALWSHLTRS